MDYQTVLQSNMKQMMDVTRETVKITLLEMYNVERAKIAANLHWLFAKAYGIDRIPEDMRDPFYTDQYEQEHIKPPVISLLVSSELYCNVLGLILKVDQKSSLRSHQCVIQALALRDIYVMEGNYRPVTHADLACMPIKLSFHMYMVDALMMAYTVEIMSLEKVVTCVKQFCTFPSEELPLNVEETIIFWVNKVNLTMRKISEKEYKAKQHPLNSASQKVRCTQEHTSDCQLPHFPVDVMRDVCDGAALLTVVHFYCPDLMKLEDICLKEDTSTADRLNNIQLLKEFANEYLNKSMYLTLEDMLYSPPVLKHNVMAFIAELFWWFEILKPEFVHQRGEQELKDALTVTQSKRFQHSGPISSATKQSFQVSTRMVESARPVPNVPNVCNSYFLHIEEPGPSDNAYCSSNEGDFKFSPPQQVLRLREKQENYQQEDNTLAFPTGNEDRQRGSPQRGGTRHGPSSSARRRLVSWAKAKSCLLRFLRRCFSFCCCYYSPEQSSKDDCLDSVPNNAVAEKKKTGMSFLFKDEQKTEEKMAKKHAALLLKQQKRAEEAQLLKQQLQAESELKRTEARRKAEQERIMKEDDKARREFIKQEHLKNKYLWQNPPKPKPKPKKRRPKTVLKDIFTDTLPKITPYTFPTGYEDRERGSPQRGGARDDPSSSARRRPPRDLNRTYIISSRGPKLNGKKDSCLDAVPTDAVYKEKKTGMCFFIKNEQKAEDEMAKKRAAFLLNQQKRAEKARLLKQQLEAERELKRTETRRKAEQERIMKEDDEARRELIKQEHLKNKYQWQNPPKPKPKKQRPKSVLKEEIFIDMLPKITSATFPTGYEDSQRGSPQRGGARDGPCSSARRRPPRALNRTYIISSSSNLDITFLHVPPSTRQSHFYNPTVTGNVRSPAEQSPGVYLHTSVAEEVLCAGQRPKLRKADLLPVIGSKVKKDSLPQSVRLDCLKHGQKLKEEKDSCLDAVPTDAVYKEKKTGMCFFIKNEQKAEDEMAKKRAALLLNQQKRAEKARLLKQQLEAERELKRTETRRS